MINLHPKYSLTIPWIGSVSIVLNLYNGDILGISSNLEYLLWYIPPLIYFIVHCTRHYYQTMIDNKWEKFREFALEIGVCFLGIILNVYWHYAWIHDKKSNYRHRTEFYDTQTLLCSIMYSILHTQYHKTNYEVIYPLDNNRIGSV